MLGDLRERLKAMNAETGATFVVIEHNMEFVMELCSRVVVLAQGKVLAQGTPAQVRANPGGHRRVPRELTRWRRAHRSFSSTAWSPAMAR